VPNPAPELSNTPTIPPVSKHWPCIFFTTPESEGEVTNHRVREADTENRVEATEPAVKCPLGEWEVARTGSFGSAGYEVGVGEEEVAAECMETEEIDDLLEELETGTLGGWTGW
jgi:hypothetical protein